MHSRHAHGLGPNHGAEHLRGDEPRPWAHSNAEEREVQRQPEHGEALAARVAYERERYQHQRGGHAQEQHEEERPTTRARQG